MLRAHGQPTLWDTLLPELALRMPATLVAVDELLDDPAFIVPFEPHFHPTGGRPSTPIETYLRLMFLKYWLDVGFEPLVELVRDSITLRRVLTYPKLQAVIGQTSELVELITLAAIVVEPTETVDIVRDPDDNRLIEAALAGDADVIVSGDQDLLTLQGVGNVRIVTPRDFLEVELQGS